MDPGTVVRFGHIHVKKPYVKWTNEIPVVQQFYECAMLVSRSPWQKSDLRFLSYDCCMKRTLPLREALSKKKGGVSGGVARE